MPIIILVMQQVLLNYATGIIYSLISYIDELYVVFLWILCLYKSGWKLQLAKDDKIIFLLGFIYLTLGLIFSFVSHYQSLNVMIIDAFTCIKFILCYEGIRQYLSTKEQNLSAINSLYRFCTKYLVLLFILGVINIFIDIFPKPDYRYGVGSIKLFYVHPTYLATSAIFCVCVIITRSAFHQTKSDKWCILMGLIVSCLTLRSKAIAGTFCIVLIYCYFIQFKLKNKIILGIVAFLTAFFIGYNQLAFYFGGYYKINNGFVREKMLIDSFSIANKYLPFGTGFGTFGSYMAVSHWSPLYDAYNYDHEVYTFMSDSFWPIIIAQTGYIGLVIFLILLWKFFTVIFKVQKTNLHLLWAGLSIILYELIASVGESALFNPAVCPLFLLLGIIINLSESEQFKSCCAKKL